MDKLTYNQLPQSARDAIPPMFREFFEKTDTEFLAINIAPEQLTGPLPFDGEAEKVIALGFIEAMLEMLKLAKEAVDENDSLKLVAVFEHMHEALEIPSVVKDDVPINMLGSEEWATIVAWRLQGNDYCDTIHAPMMKWVRDNGGEIEYE